MQTPIIRVGNSKGIRLSKALLERYALVAKVELVFEKDHIVLKPIKRSRMGWARAFKKMRKHGDDALMIPDVFNDEVFDKW